MIPAAVAARLYHSYLATLINSGRPIDRKVAKAEFKASTQVVYAFGVGNTPFHVEITVLETIRPTYTSRPNFGTVNNSKQQKFDADLIHDLHDALAAIDTNEEV